MNYQTNEDNPIWKIGNKHYRGGRKSHNYLEINNKWLSEYLDVSVRTITRWIKKGKLDPTDIKSIVRCSAN